MKFLSTLRNKITGLVKSEEGASAIEYAVLAGIVVVALYGVFNTSMGTVFTNAFAKITSAIAGT